MTFVAIKCMLLALNPLNTGQQNVRLARKTSATADCIVARLIPCTLFEMYRLV